MRGLNSLFAALTLAGVIATPQEATAFMEELYTTNSAMRQTLFKTRMEAQDASFDRVRQVSAEREPIFDKPTWGKFISDDPKHVEEFNSALGIQLKLEEPFDINSAYHFEVMLAKVDFLYVRSLFENDDVLRWKLAKKISDAIRSHAEKDRNFWPPELHKLTEDDLSKMWVEHDPKRNEPVSEILELRGGLRIVMNRCIAGAGTATPSSHRICSAAFRIYFDPKGIQNP
ncbi:MAG: hypothetical protein EBQ96_07360 [Proteobacteria bacterium]|nr:hypothetical protein [Pseudomonadota bacterium]